MKAQTIVTARNIDVHFVNILSKKAMDIIQSRQAPGIIVTGTGETKGNVQVVLTKNDPIVISEVTRLFNSI